MLISCRTTVYMALKFMMSSSGLRELYHKIAPYTHRKRKFEVLKDLPDKINENIMLEMDENEYDTYFKIEESWCTL